MVGPEQGATLPGMTVVCGDSHTATHGAFAAMAQGTGHVRGGACAGDSVLAATQIKNQLIKVEGTLGKGVTGKGRDFAHHRWIGTAGGNGTAIEFAGSAIRP